MSLKISVEVNSLKKRRTGVIGSRSRRTTLPLSFTRKRAAVVSRQMRAYHVFRIGQQTANSFMYVTGEEQRPPAGRDREAAEPKQEEMRCRGIEMQD